MHHNNDIHEVTITEVQKKNSLINDELGNDIKYT